MYVAISRVLVLYWGLHWHQGACLKDSRRFELVVQPRIQKLDSVPLSAYFDRTIVKHLSGGSCQYQSIYRNCLRCGDGDMSAEFGSAKSAIWCCGVLDFIMAGSSLLLLLNLFILLRSFFLIFAFMLS